MAIILFIVDNSLSMAQRTYKGNSHLDVAKCAIETFLKVRARDESALRDRYMLFTLDQPPFNVKVGWRETMSTFSERLKAIRATGLTSLGISLKHALDVVNLNRLSTGMDTYGQGYFPLFMETSIIIILTDVDKLTDPSGCPTDLLLPMANTCPGFELTEEPFSWDQRIFSLVLDMNAQPPNGIVAHVPYATSSHTHAMCEVTGGRSYLINSIRTLQQAIESLAAKVVGGVVVRFEHYDPNRASDAPVSWQSVRRMIYVPKAARKIHSNLNWPIPEKYWPTSELASIPPRSAHPVIHFVCQPVEAPNTSIVPEDKYELESSALTRYVLERCKPDFVWQTFIMGSSHQSSALGYPFGFLQAHPNLQTVFLHVLPYNYPELIPLLEEIDSAGAGHKPSEQWVARLRRYLSTIPGYYFPGIHQILHRRGLGNYVSESPECCFSYGLQTYLRRVKTNAKAEFENIKGYDDPLPAKELTINWRPNEICSTLFCSIGAKEQSLITELSEQFRIRRKATEKLDFANQWMVDRDSLIPTYEHLCAVLTNPTQSEHFTDASRHAVPIQEMGDFQRCISRQPSPLRELESHPVRQHIFGNPFKTTKVIDECDDLLGSDGADSSRRSSTDGSSILAEKRRKWNEFLRTTQFRRDSLAEKPIVTEEQCQPIQCPAEDLPTDSPVKEQDNVLSTEDIELLFEEQPSDDYKIEIDLDQKEDDLTMIFEESAGEKSCAEDVESEASDSSLSSDEQFWLDYEENGGTMPWWANENLVNTYYDLKMRCFRIIRSQKKEQRELFSFLRSHVRPCLPHGSAECFIDELKKHAAEWNSDWLVRQLNLCGLECLTGSQQVHSIMRASEDDDICVME